MTNAPSAPAKKSTAWWSPGWGWKMWTVTLLLLIPTFGFAVWVLVEAGGQTKIDPATITLARENAVGEPGEITAITGTEHTVYHSNSPLPEAKAHREDGRVTLVWFTTTSCGRCEDQAFVHQAVHDLGADFVFVEKEMGREPAAERLGVSEAPTFVWLDAEGNELGRFTELADAAALRAEVERAPGARKQ